LFTRQRKTRFSDNRKNEDVSSCTECFISGLREASLGQENTEEYRREGNTDTGESYRVVEAQSENKMKKRDWAQTWSPNSYKERLRVEVLKTLCVIVPVTFSNVINVCRSGDCRIIRFFNPEGPLISCRVTRIRDSILSCPSEFCTVICHTILPKLSHQNLLFTGLRLTPLTKLIIIRNSTLTSSMTHICVCTVRSA
jgi:hypothetical protein